MWANKGNIPQGTGTLEDMIARARQKYNDVDMQAKCVKNCIDIIKRDHGDIVRMCNFDYSGYEGVLTMFPNGGEIYAYWELYEFGALEASGVEKYTPNNNEYKVIFTSSSDFDMPILPQIINN